MPAPIVSAQRVRIVGDHTEFTRDIKNVLRANETLRVRSGGKAQFEVAHFLGADLAAISNFDQVALEIKPLGANDGAPAPSTAYHLRKIVTPDAFDDTLTAETWADGSKQHFLFEFSDAEMTRTGTLWLLLYAITDAGGTITLAAGKITFEEDGGPGGTLPEDSDPALFYDRDQSDARYARRNQRRDRITLSLEDVGTELADNWAAETTIQPVTFAIPLTPGSGDVSLVLGTTGARDGMVVHCPFVLSAGDGNQTLYFYSGSTEGPTLDSFIPLEAAETTGILSAYYDADAGAWQLLTSNLRIP